MTDESSHYLLVEERGDVRIARLNGNVADFEFCQEVAPQLLSLANEFVPPKILIDFAHIPCVQTSMLGCLVKLSDVAQQAGGEVRLCNLHPNVQEVFQITKLINLFEIAPDESAALQEWETLGD